MSSIGTGIATGVAAVAQTAQQTARNKDLVRNTQQRVAKDNADSFVERLQSAGQADDPDAELPDHQAPGYEQLYLHDGDGEPISPDPLKPEAAERSDKAPDISDQSPPPPGHPLYQHLDIKA
ncbi:hypothetical protein [Algisphaera agarilytica]|uniref:Uncharacterized protein n=1 Tax=Algisphaera agarilytica TaxID=1385975 RepID=A0A7X0LLR5_9BACT|nr:hypothetical protein [Algisphaera agarilytica]MBB6430248.1 hypothetical protein [Algisphaera agarilytica]